MAINEVVSKRIFMTFGKRRHIFPKSSKFGKKNFSYGFVFILAMCCSAAICGLYCLKLRTNNLRIAWIVGFAVLSSDAINKVGPIYTGF